MGKQTILYPQHVEAGAKIVDFGGWDMPINYGSQIEEHNSVRQACGVFDVSHMTVVDVTGTEAKNYLQYLLANDVDRLVELGKALYSAMLNQAGGVVDDLIVYRMSFGYRVVVNCATREKDLAWMHEHSREFDVELIERPELSILAVHGPESLETVVKLVSESEAEQVAKLKNFSGVELADRFIARTGYTGEKGVEFIIPQEQAPELWRQLLAAGVRPIGLGARDTLRLEAGMNLYGHDMDENTSPIAANMEQTIAFEPASRDFIGRSAVTSQREMLRQGELPRLVGLVLETRGVLREGQEVITPAGAGIITSGSFSPTLKHSIALARIPANAQSCEVDLRGTRTAVRIVKPNFVRFGRKVFE